MAWYVGLAFVGLPGGVAVRVVVVRGCACGVVLLVVGVGVCCWLGALGGCWLAAGLLALIVGGVVGAGVAERTLLKLLLLAVLLLLLLLLGTLLLGAPLLNRFCDVF